MVRRSILLLALFLLPAPALSDERGFRLSGDDVAVEVPAGADVSRKTARKMLHEVRTAFAKTANFLAVNSRQVFFTGGPLPFFMPESVRKDPAIRAVLENRFRTAKNGREPYIERLRGGETTIHLMAPADEIDAEGRHRLHREMTYAILAQTLWRGCPVWFAEGLAECLAEDASEGQAEICRLLRDELRAEAGSLQVEALLGTTDREAWGKASGRAVSWAAMRLLLMSRKKLVPMLYHQCRALVSHLRWVPVEAAVDREYTDVMRAELARAGVTPDVLTTAIGSWIDAGFPTGSKFRRTEAYKLLSRGKIPRMLGTGIQARWGLSGLGVEGTHNQVFSGGQLVWELPWESRMRVYLAVHGRPGTSYGLRSKKDFDGWMAPLVEWDAAKKGRRGIPAVTLACPTQRNKHGLVVLWVSNGYGNGYLYTNEQKLK